LERTVFENLEILLFGLFKFNVFELVDVVDVVELIDDGNGGSVIFKKLNNSIFGLILYCIGYIYLDQSNL
jgi:hypothetical protein